MLTMILTGQARANQYPLVHQLDFLFLGYFFGVFLFFCLGFVCVFSLNSDLTYPTAYYMLSWPYLPINNQPPSFSPTYLLCHVPTFSHLPTFQISTLPTYMPTTYQQPPQMVAYLLTCPNPPTYLHIHNVVVNNEHFDIAGPVFQFHVPNSLPIHPYA